MCVDDRSDKRRIMICPKTVLHTLIKLNKYKVSMRATRLMQLSCQFSALRLLDFLLLTHWLREEGPYTNPVQSTSLKVYI